ncbi:MAG TPA: M28 family peptidase, partial [Trueperaceae bacterium]|nr:M28 family peptidase [Trueperaceae bacterium]
ISLPGPARLEVEGRGHVIDGISHAFAVPTGDGGLSAWLVDGRTTGAGAGGEAGSGGGFDVRGALVLVDGMASGVTFKTWEARGAVGQIHVHDDHLHETSISPVWGNPDERGLDEMPRTPSLAIRRADGERLRALLAQEGPVTVSITTQALTEWRPIPLLTAQLPGAPATPYVLLSSHVDSWYYGAMDNGSANATTLEVARILGEQRESLSRGLRVAFWSGHSHGRFAGSAWFADQNWQDLYENCVAHVFVDSTGGIDATIITEPPVMPQTHALAAEVIESLTGEKFEGKRIGRFADQSFYAIGLNSIFGTLSEQDASKNANTISFKTGGRRAGGLGWWWHTPDDTIDKVDESFLVRDTRIYLAAVHRLLTAPLLPFDYRPAIDEIIAVVGPRVEAAKVHLDLSDLVADLERAREAIRAFHGLLEERGEGASHEFLASANAALLKLSRHLVPIAFHESGRFERDMAAPLVPVPSLRELEALAGMDAEDVAAHPLATRLHRNANRVRFGVRGAVRVAEEVVSELGA